MVARLGTDLKDTAQEQQLLRSRIVGAGVMVGALILILLARVIELQVIEYEHFKTRSRDNRVKIVPLPPNRGLIRDRNGVLLAQNVPTYSLEVIPESVGDLEATLIGLKELVELDESDEERFRAALSSKQRFESIPLRSRLSEAEVARFAVNRHRFPGVDVHARLTRDYPLGTLGAHLLGYVGRISPAELNSIDQSNYRGTSHIGKTGVERAYEDVLHGKVGYSQVETNAQGRTLRVLERTDPVPGANLNLSVDISLQATAEAVFEGKSGALVAIDPRTGGVLALVSTPGYDPNLFVHGIDRKSYRELSDSPERPLFNRALSGQYPPGSTIKPFLGLAAIEADAAIASEGITCHGYFQLPGHSHRYRDWKRYGHGRVGFHDAIVQSCDVYFYALAHELGIERMHEFMTRFGFGVRTGIDLESEARGLMPSAAWKRKAHGQVWFPGETLIAGIGQGFMLSTPLQLASATATLATRGRRIKPRVVERLTDPVTRGEIVVSPEVMPEVALTHGEAWAPVVQAMVGVMHAAKGTARRAGEGSGVRIAGKTGTAQVYSVGQDEKYDKDNTRRELRDHGLFVAFAPADDPAIAIAVVVEHGGSGSRSAAPIARRVIDAYLGSPDAPAEIAGPKLTAVTRATDD